MLFPSSCNNGCTELAPIDAAQHEIQHHHDEIRTGDSIEHRIERDLCRKHITDRQRPGRAADAYPAAHQYRQPPPVVLPRFSSLPSLCLYGALLGAVIASEAKQSRATHAASGLLRRYAPRNDVLGIENYLNCGRIRNAFSRSICFSSSALKTPQSATACAISSQWPHGTSVPKTI